MTHKTRRNYIMHAYFSVSFLILRWFAFSVESSYREASEVGSRWGRARRSRLLRSWNATVDIRTELKLISRHEQGRIHLSREEFSNHLRRKPADHDWLFMTFQGSNQVGKLQVTCEPPLIVRHSPRKSFLHTPATRIVSWMSFRSRGLFSGQWISATQLWPALGRVFLGSSLDDENRLEMLLRKKFLFRMRL